MISNTTRFAVPAGVVFLASCLFVCAQPLLGRTLLPAFSGSAAVWTVLPPVHQMPLLAGYGNAKGSVA